MNWLLVATTLGLGIFGLVAIYDAGNNPGWQKLPNFPEDISSAWKKQQLWLGIGMAVFFVVSLIDYRHLKWIAIPAYLGSLVLLVLALLQDDSAAVHSTKGWLTVPGIGISIQPSQAAIASSIILVALLFGEAHKLPKVGDFFANSWVQFLCTGMILGIPCLLVIAAGDVGSGIVWLPVAIALLLVGKTPYPLLINLILGIAIALPLVYFFGIKNYESRASRIDDWLAMNRGEEVDSKGSAWAITKGSMAIGSAGWEGKGRRNAESVHGLGHIPQKTCHTDFIFVIIAEQWGFQGSALLLLGYAFLLFLCLLSGFFARDLTGRVLCAGVIGLLFAHIYQNIGMSLLLVPITGIPLPLVSYGGTFALIILFLLALVQSVWTHRFLPKRNPTTQEN